MSETPTGQEARERLAAVRTEVAKAVVGQDAAVSGLLVALLCGGHVLMEGVPGVAKTLLVRTLAGALSVDTRRVQFTPDLMPGDITGSMVIDSRQGELSFREGPIFTHLLLADEINRTPPKTQSALLEAMQEHRVTVQGTTYTLDEPFFVFATQNPIELEGTYPLPEAQLDRFMFEIVIDYLAEDDEVAVVQGTTGLGGEAVRPAVTVDELLAFQRLVRAVPAADAVARYAVSLVRASRPGPAAPDAVRKYLSYGASVRAAQWLVLGGKARALMHGRHHVSFDDVRALARPVLRHRLLTNFHAKAERVTTDDVITEIVKSVAVPKSGM
jgi:MoxR-like ATPase